MVSNREYSGAEERIQELLALTESSEAGEAARAAADAQDLLDVYNLGRYLGAAREEPDGERNTVPIIATRHVFFNEPSHGVEETPEDAGGRRATETKLWQGLMHALCEHTLCRSIDDGRFNDHFLRHSAGFTVVGDPVNVRATIALFKWQKERIEGQIARRWPRFQARLSAQGRNDGGLEAFRENFVREAVSDIQQAMRQRRLDRGMEGEMAAVGRFHRAAIARFVNEYLDLRRDPSLPSSEGYRLVEEMGRETGKQ